MSASVAHFPAEALVDVIGPENGRQKNGVIPSQAGHEVVQLVVTRQAEAGRHGLQALALAGAEQATQVERRSVSPRLAPEHL